MSLYSRIPRRQQGSSEFLRTVSLFRSLSDEALEDFCTRVPYRTFAPGVTLFHQDMPGSTMYLLEEGAVRVYAVGLTGQEQTLNTFGPGMVFGELSILGEDSNRSASAITMSESKVWLVARQDLEYLLDRYPQVTREMIRLLVRRVRAAARQVEVIIFQDVLGRLAFQLLNLAERLGEETQNGILISMPLTQSELATIVGATRESVNKAISLLRSENLIEVNGTNLVVIDKNKLLKIVQERGR